MDARQLGPREQMMDSGSVSFGDSGCKVRITHPKAQLFRKRNLWQTLNWRSRIFTKLEIVDLMLIFAFTS